MRTSRSVWSASGLPALFFVRLPADYPKREQALALQTVRDFSTVSESANTHLKMDYLPPTPEGFALRLVVAKEPVPSTKAWPHAPVHRLTEHGICFITAGTLEKCHLFDTPAKRDLLEEVLLSVLKASNWQLEAWAVFTNHYHFVARGHSTSVPMNEVLRELHSRSAIVLNKRDRTPNRPVWHNFWDTRLTHQYSYLARLNYVHQNAVKHGLVAAANQYPWCSAAWFERAASPSQVKTIYSFKIDQINVPDDF